MDYRKELTKCNRIVVKIGTSMVTYPNGKINLERMEHLARVLADIRNRGIDVILVSSGAVGVGAGILGFDCKPTDIRMKQAAAAAGQASMMQIYKRFFGEYNQNVAQILLTKEDIKSKHRSENLENTFNTVLELGMIPIVNNNDAITIDEIEFSDNDNLSAVVAKLVKADLLVLLTDIDGLYDKHPKEHDNAVRLSIVAEINEEVKAMAGEKGSAFSVGGMLTKITAAEMCVETGTSMVIALGENPRIIYRILEGEDVGTLFPGVKNEKN
ncbi:MAG: glutamate 5-kinase [Peptostreptococcaceae bacterium]|nr:glutamate 5-kinase [Peptostreptococcaceae bacterium]